MAIVALVGTAVLSAQTDQAFEPMCRPPDASALSPLAAIDLPDGCFLFRPTEAPWLCRRGRGFRFHEVFREELVLFGFEKRKAELKAEHLKALDGLVAKFRSPGVAEYRVLSIRGGASETGPEADNEVYSQNRVRAVWDYLEDKVPANRLEKAASLGSTQPQVSAPGRERAINRYAEITYEYGEVKLIPWQAEELEQWLRIGLAAKRKEIDSIKKKHLFANTERIKRISARVLCDEASRFFMGKSLLQLAVKVEGNLADLPDSDSMTWFREPSTELLPCLDKVRSPDEELRLAGSSERRRRLEEAFRNESRGSLKAFLDVAGHRKRYADLKNGEFLMQVKKDPYFPYTLGLIPVESNGKIEYEVSPETIAELNRIWVSELGEEWLERYMGSIRWEESICPLK